MIRTIAFGLQGHVGNAKHIGNRSLVIGFGCTKRQRIGSTLLGRTVLVGCFGGTTLSLGRNRKIRSLGFGIPNGVNVVGTEGVARNAIVAVDVAVAAAVAVFLCFESKIVLLGSIRLSLLQQNHLRRFGDPSVGRLLGLWFLFLFLGCCFSFWKTPFWGGISPPDPEPRGAGGPYLFRQGDFKVFEVGLGLWNNCLSVFVFVFDFDFGTTLVLLAVVHRWNYPLFDCVLSLGLKALGDFPPPPPEFVGFVGIAVIAANVDVDVSHRSAAIAICGAAASELLLVFLDNEVVKQEMILTAYL